MAPYSFSPRRIRLGDRLLGLDVAAGSNARLQ